MHVMDPTLDPRFSDPDVQPTAWADAVRENDLTKLQAMADAYRAKYDDLFPYEVVEGRLQLEDAPGEVVAYRLLARKAFGFGKSPFSQTRWRFDN